MKGHNVLLIAGGLGLAPLRAPIFYVTENRADFEDVHILYGTKRPEQLLFDYQYEQWRRIDDVNLQIIVEEPDDAWNGPVGHDHRAARRHRARAPQDLRHRLRPAGDVQVRLQHALSEAGMPMQRMFVSLERRMHCGMGKCCRCNVGSTYTCIDGPVFDYWTVMNLKEAI